jgi:hypothetical protein
VKLKKSTIRSRVGGPVRTRRASGEALRPSQPRLPDDCRGDPNSQGRHPGAQLRIWNRLRRRLTGTSEPRTGLLRHRRKLWQYRKRMLYYQTRPNGSTRGACILVYFSRRPSCRCIQSIRARSRAAGSPQRVRTSTRMRLRIENTPQRSLWLSRWRALSTGVVLK